MLRHKQGIVFSCLFSTPCPCWQHLRNLVIVVWEWLYWSFSWLNHYTVPNIYGGLLPKAYGTSIQDAHRCANTLQPLKQVFSFRNDSKTTTLTKSKPCSHVLSCLSKVFARSEVDVCVIIISVVFFDFLWTFLLA